MDGIGFFLLLALIVSGFYGFYYWGNLKTKKGSAPKSSP